MRVIGLALAVLSLSVAAAPKKPGRSKAKAAPVESVSPAVQSARGPTRIDFDDRLIQGQSNKSGSVYLYDRKELKTSSMVKVRENFRQEITDSLDGN